MGCLEMNSQIVFGRENLIAVFTLLRFLASVGCVVGSKLLGRRKFMVALVALILLEMGLQVRYHIIHFVGVVAITMVALEVHWIPTQHCVVLNPRFSRFVVVIFRMDLRIQCSLCGSSKYLR